MYVPPVAVPIPTTTPAIQSLTVASGEGRARQSGLLMLVMPSPIVPESSAASRAGAGGAAGIVVSIVREKTVLAGLTLPAASVIVAVTA